MSEKERGPGFILKRNIDKVKPNHPDYKGWGTGLDGKEFWVSAWIHEKEGKKYLSASIQPREERKIQEVTVASQFPDDDVSF